eukprot:UC4_evm1s574
MSETGLGLDDVLSSENHPNDTSSKNNAESDHSEDGGDYDNQNDNNTEHDDKKIAIGQSDYKGDEPSKTCILTERSASQKSFGYSEETSMSAGQRGSMLYGFISPNLNIAINNKRSSTNVSAYGFPEGDPRAPPSWTVKAKLERLGAKQRRAIIIQEMASFRRKLRSVAVDHSMEDQFSGATLDPLKVAHHILSARIERLSLAEPLHPRVVRWFDAQGGFLSSAPDHILEDLKAEYAANDGFALEFQVLLAESEVLGEKSDNGEGSELRLSGPGSGLNAMFIYPLGFGRSPSFVLCDSPAPATCGEFWTMVRRVRASVIVNLDDSVDSVENISGHKTPGDDTLDYDKPTLELVDRVAEECTTEQEENEKSLNKESIDHPSKGFCYWPSEDDGTVEIELDGGQYLDITSIHSNSVNEENNSSTEKNHPIRRRFSIRKRNKNSSDAVDQIDFHHIAGWGSDGLPASSAEDSEGEINGIRALLESANRVMLQQRTAEARMHNSAPGTDLPIVVHTRHLDGRAAVFLSQCAVLASLHSHGFPIGQVGNYGEFVDPTVAQPENLRARTSSINRFIGSCFSTKQRSMGVSHLSQLQKELLEKQYELRILETRQRAVQAGEPDFSHAPDIVAIVRSMHECGCPVVPSVEHYEYLYFAARESILMCLDSLPSCLSPDTVTSSSQCLKMQIYRITESLDFGKRLLCKKQCSADGYSTFRSSVMKYGFELLQMGLDTGTIVMEELVKLKEKISIAATYSHEDLQAVRNKAAEYKSDVIIRKSANPPSTTRRKKRLGSMILVKSNTIDEVSNLEDDGSEVIDKGSSLAVDTSKAIDKGSSLEENKGSRLEEDTSKAIDRGSCLEEDTSKAIDDSSRKGTEREEIISSLTIDSNHFDQNQRIDSEI